MESLDRISYLLKKYKKGEISLEELTELQEWANLDPSYGSLLKEFKPNDSGESLEEFLLKKEYLKPKSTLSFLDILNKIDSPPKKQKIQHIRLLIAAAIVLIVLVGGLVRYKHHRGYEYESVLVNMAPKLAPAGSRALLKNAEGALFNLDATKGFKIQENILSFFDDQKKEEKLKSGEELTLFVPKGGEYQIMLSDGTKVTLNANSKLVFPSQFGKDERKVSLEGEAYFEVTKNPLQPFIVSSKNQEIKVLGTSFNLKSYPDDEMESSTLFEGKVQVKGNINNSILMLKPGDMSLVGTDGSVKKVIADLEGVAAWRQGLFSYKSTKFSEVIKEVSRWYNVEVVYEGEEPTQLFSGQVSRNVEFNIMLEFLKGSGIDLILKGEKLIIK